MTTYRSGTHSVYLLHAHLVFVTKYRRKVFNQAILEHLRAVFEQVCNQWETHLVEFEGEEDHVHLLINYPPKLALSLLVNRLKGVSSRVIHQQQYPSIQRQLWGGALWSNSYFVSSCGGAPIEIIRQYIENQATPQH